MREERSVELREEVIAAEGRLRGRARETPVERSLVLEAECGAEVWLKLENHQRTGSFKFRGALNRLLCLDADERASGVVAASSGNHGLAVAAGAAELGVPAVVYVPEVASPSKTRAIAAAGAEVRVHGHDCVIAEAEARAECERSGAVYLSPYNDTLVAAGQGTIGRELLRQVEPLDRVYVSVGGGGLIAGIASVLKAEWPQLRVVGCSPSHSPVMRACVEAGRIVEREALETLSDGTAGGVEEGAVTFEWCRELVDEWVDVEEDEIADAVRLVVEHHHCLVEGAAGVAVAGFQRQATGLRGQRVAIVLCGANIGRETLRTLL